MPKYVCGQSGSLRFQFIADAANCVDHRLAVAQIELLANEFHIGVNIIRADLRLQSLDTVENDLARHDDPEILRQKIKDLKLAGRQLDHLFLFL